MSLIFPSPRTCGRWTPTGLSLAVERVAKKADIDASPHDLRRTFASMLAARGVPAWRIRDYLGHASIATTEGYYVARGSIE
ncbi:MAG: site-specific integrase, partial [Gammaproteobacteria bacterium]|nr:site-specific integrase [Gammaproteobacteria bacterium]